MTTVAFHNCVGREVAPSITLDRRRRRLSSIVKRHADPRRPFMVSIHRAGAMPVLDDDSVRLRATWKETLVGGGDIVSIVYLPRGGGGGGDKFKSIGGALAMIALALAVPWALRGNPALAATGGGLSLVGKAVAAGVMPVGEFWIGRAVRCA